MRKTPLRTFTRVPLASLGFLALLLVAGCSAGSGGSEPGENEGGDPPGQSGPFESYWPGAGGYAAGPMAAADATAGEGMMLDGSGAAQNAGGSDAARAIVEADIIQVQGDRLYALSRTGGLSVIDISERDRLQMLGKYQETRQAEPFEMYLREDVALVMFSDWGQYVRNEDETGWAWVQVSKLLALDVSDPADIRLLGGFEIPGAISDSRIVGDVLYLVGYQDGYCWDCAQGSPRTSVISLDLSDPARIAKVDQLDYEDDDNQWGWNRRSITVTTERMYVAGPEYGDQGPVGSTIQVVDISDPGGQMVEGARVQAEGQISSRWQMDEHQDVLRVISQPPVWNLDEPPVVQTFTVVSSQQLEPLGRTELQLPRPEQLQSTRFDGPRAYAITFERTDPLFTIDLSDPAAPRQAGELEMPGWVYHMEPRGERLFGLGFDQGAAEGSITVSLFDVSDLAQPTMLSRVNFGGDWGQLPEDQDRIHKAFRVLDDLGLVLVPFSGWSYQDMESCGYHRSGVQLVDMDLGSDTLTLRGMAPSLGEARRAFLHDTRLFTVNDQRVAIFDIDDRSAPALTAELALTRNVGQMFALHNGTVARLGGDWWTNEMILDLVEMDDVELPQAGTAELSLNQEALDDTGGCDDYMYVQSAHAQGDLLFLLYRAERYNDVDWTLVSGLLVVDASDPGAPAVLARQEWPLNQNWWYFDGYYSYGVSAGGTSVVHTAKALAMMEASWEDTGSGGTNHYRLRVIDISDPDNPSSQVLALPDAESYGGLVASGDLVATSHYQPVAGSPGTVRFYLDRFDLSDPSAPRALEPLNVPGGLMHLDAAKGRAVTSELRQLGTEEGMSWEQCAERFARFDFEWDENIIDWDAATGTCTGHAQVLHLVALRESGAALLDSYRVAEDRNAVNASLGDGVLFATLSQNSYGYGPMIMMDCFGPCGGYYGGATDPSELLVLGGIDANAFQVGRIEIEDMDQWQGWWGASQVYAAGRMALVVGNSELAIVDAGDPAHPVVQGVRTVAGYIQHVAVDGDRALLSLGEYGAQVIDLR